ncbi:MAG: ACT domain-containing protein [Ruegeria sp.]
MTDKPVKDTLDMIAGMDPVLTPGEFAFVRWDNELPWPDGTLASCVEDEGLSLVVPIRHAPDDAISMRCITLRVHSSLEGVGLTAAVAGALAENGIAANMVAGFHHDHVYVPSSLAEAAVNILKRLQKGAEH